MPAFTYLKALFAKSTTPVCMYVCASRTAMLIKCDKRKYDIVFMKLKSSVGYYYY